MERQGNVYKCHVQLLTMLHKFCRGVMIPRLHHIYGLDSLILFICLLIYNKRPHYFWFILSNDIMVSHMV